MMARGWFFARAWSSLSSPSCPSPRIMSLTMRTDGRFEPLMGASLLSSSTQWWSPRMDRWFLLLDGCPSSSGRRDSSAHNGTTVSLKNLARYGYPHSCGVAAQERVTLSMMVRSARLRFWLSSLVRPLRRRASNSRT
jgi:hypothetical protein